MTPEPPPDGDRDGETFDPGLDRSRLNSLARRVFDFAWGGRWLTYAEISAATGGSEGSVGARLRDFRKERFGKYVVDRRRVSKGLYEYRLLPPLGPKEEPLSPKEEEPEEKPGPAGLPPHIARRLERRDRPDRGDS